MRLNLIKDLSNERDMARTIVNMSVAKIRTRYITDLPGQDMLYMQKEKEARLFLANPEIDEDVIPVIVGEAEDEQMSVLDKAEEIIAKAQEWEPLNRLIERKRRQALVTIDNSTSPAQIRAAADIDWSDMP